MSLLASTLQFETQERGKLHENAFAKALLPLMGRFTIRLTDSDDEDNAKRIASEVRSVIMGIAKHTYQSSSEPDYALNPCDYRIRGIHVKGVRTFPAKGNRYYGIKMSRRPEECCSSVFLGTNGIGKSSFYCALEWACMGYSDSANHRGYNKTAQPEFIRNLGSTLENVSILLETCSGNMSYTVTEPVNPIAYPAFFCMERDVELLSKNLSESYIAYQLGVLDFQVFLQTLRKILKEYDDGMANLAEVRNMLRNHQSLLWLMDKVNRLEPEQRSVFWVYLEDGEHTLNHAPIDNATKAVLSKKFDVYLREIIGSLLPGENDVEAPKKEDVLAVLPKYTDTLFKTETDVSLLGELQRDEYLRKLSSVYSELHKLITDWTTVNKSHSADIEVLPNALDKQKKKIRKAEKLVAQVADNYPAIQLSEMVISDLKEILSVMNYEYHVLLSDLKEKANIVFQALFEEFTQLDLRKVELQVIPDLKVVVTARTSLDDAGNESVVPTGPRQFLNNFRFKLFCVSLKVALAFTCSAITGLVFPIVMDDVFDSSDFSNRLNIRKFITNLFRVHDEIFKEQYPLQIIFFTQDDVVGEAVVRGIREYNPKGGVKYSRLFSFLELAEKEHVPLNLQHLFGFKTDNPDATTGYVEDIIS